MEKLTVTLKQHTPLIHFQHEQEGATLRVSEVKPKLDRFIITNFGEGNYDKGLEQIKKKYSEWLIGKGEHPALDYKMHIRNGEKGELKEYLIASYLSNNDVSKLKVMEIEVLDKTPYFAQEKENKEIIESQDKKSVWDNIKKKGLLFTGDIEITIKALKKELIIEIQKFIQSFFIVNNFGTRQNKGFGCFEVIKIEVEENSLKKPISINRQIIEESLIANFAFVYKKIVSDDLNKIFSRIKEDYQTLKSGTPNKNSLLMNYGLNLKEKIYWEKKFIKYWSRNVYIKERDIFYQLKGKVVEDEEEEENLNYKYVRGLLGLAEQYEYLLKNPPSKDENNKMIVSIKPKNENIQRYKSPLLFKVYNNIIYLVGNDIDSEIKGELFLFLVNFQGDEGCCRDDLLGGPIAIPDNISLPKFMQYAMSPDKKMGYKSLKK